MITRLLVGVARSLFLLACAFLAVAGLALYAAVRLLKAAFKRESPMPVRDATFATITALIVLARAVQATQAKTGNPPAAGEVEPVEAEPEPLGSA